MCLHYYLQKMLWAVTNALREETMGMSHELFRPCMSVLFKACQKLWLTKVARLAQGGSTSENMLALAKQFTTYTINQISQDPTAEHMAMVCGNIIKLAESQYRSLSSAKHIVFDENTRDELKSTKSSPIRPHDSSELLECDKEKECSFKEDLVCSRNTDNTFNTSLKQNSPEKRLENSALPNKLNSSSKIKFLELRVALTRIEKSKDNKGALNSPDTKVDSSSNSSRSTLKGICQKSKQLCRVSRRISGEFCEVLSATKENANVSYESPKGQRWIVSTIDQSSVVCHDESSKTEESKNKIVDSDQIVKTPIKNNKKINTPNKDSPNVYSRVTRRKSNELIELNTSGDLKIQLSEPAIEIMKSPKNISHQKTKIALTRKDEENTKPKSSYQSPRLSKKSYFNERKKSKNMKENILYVEAGSSSLSSQTLDYLEVETDYILTSNPSQESILPVKVPETAVETITTLTTNDKCTAMNELEACTTSPPKNNRPLKSILCKPVTRTLRSNSKDSPVKSVTLKENDTVYYDANCNFDRENKTNKSTKPKRRKSLTSTSAELGPQKINLMESKCAETLMSPVIVDFDETEESLSQECEVSNLDRQVCEKNKENIENQIVANNSFSECKFEVDNACTSPVKRLPILTAYPPFSQKVPEETFNRTLQLYRLSNSGGADVSTSRVAFAEPPVLVPHWDHQPQQQKTSR